MINKNELRIGNWYLSFGVDYQQVEQITKGKVLIDFNPIPLTEDILLKCGFHKDKYGIYEYVKDNEPYVSGCKILLWAKFHNDKFQICLGEDLCNLCEIALTQHLHQLQNLYFALTGEELICNLK